jgi:hypothetical protein
LERVLWIDMLVYGTAINVASGLAALALFANAAPTAVAAAVHFAPLPYNLFLVVAVWKAADATREQSASIARVVSLAWLVASIVI